MAEGVEGSRVRLRSSSEARISSTSSMAAAMCAGGVKCGRYVRREQGVRRRVRGADRWAGRVAPPTQWFPLEMLFLAHIGCILVKCKRARISSREGGPPSAPGNLMGMIWSSCHSPWLAQDMLSVNNAAICSRNTLTLHPRTSISSFCRDERFSAHRSWEVTRDRRYPPGLHSGQLRRIIWWGHIAPPLPQKVQIYSARP